MYIKRKKLLLICLMLTLNFIVSSQQTWPSKTWNNAINISSALPTDAAELSGLYWNDLTSRLYCVGDGGSLYILQYNKTTGQYTLIGSSTNIGAPEGITQVNKADNEFYTIDEGSYEIRKFTHNSDFSNITKSNTWNLLKSPSPMTDTGNDGPEGIAFIPDWYLQKIGFISTVTGQNYYSTKGMGGLIFLAHQKGGSIWVYDVNPIVNQDFIYVGNYLTNRSESCELAFDSSTGLLYILHNIDDNYLELNDLSTSIIGGKYKLNTFKEYLIPNPTGTANVEGFAISQKFPADESMGVFLCRDVKKETETVDALRWFSTYLADGKNIRTGIIDNLYNDYGIKFVVNDKNIIIDTEEGISYQNLNIKLYNLQGSLVQNRTTTVLPVSLNIENCQQGIYFLTISDYINMVHTFKFIITQ